MANFGRNNGDTTKKSAGIQRMLALSRYVNQQKDEPSVLNHLVRDVVVATRYIPVGIIITADMVELRPMPTDTNPGDLFTDVALVAGLRARASIGEGDPVRISAVITDAPLSPSQAPV